MVTTTNSAYPNLAVPGRLCPCGVRSEGARHTLDGCVCAPGCRCAADGLGVDAPPAIDILWRRTPVDYGAGEPDTADCMRDPDLPLDLPGLQCQPVRPGAGALPGHLPGVRTRPHHLPYRAAEAGAGGGAAGSGRVRRPLRPALRDAGADRLGRSLPDGLEVESLGRPPVGPGSAGRCRR